MATIGTRLFTWLKGTQVGSDELGNVYYQSRRKAADGTLKRWVIYDGLAEPSKVPARWHRWLHYTADETPAKEGTPRYFWQKPHRPNMTGTMERYLPPGHLDKGGKRDASASGDYEAWKP